MSKLNITLENVSDVVELETGYVIGKAGFSFSDVTDELLDILESIKDEPQIDFFADVAPVTPTEPAYPVKVGDRVRVTTDRFGETQKGDIGIVVECHGDRGSFQLEVDFTKPGSRCQQPIKTNDYSFEDVEVIEGFIVGDKVKVSDYAFHSLIKGQIGIIKGDTCYDAYKFLVVAKDGTYDHHMPSDLTFA